MSHYCYKELFSVNDGKSGMKVETFVRKWSLVIGKGEKGMGKMPAIFHFPFYKFLFVSNHFPKAIDFSVN
jgi:hypothetical protein